MVKEKVLRIYDKDGFRRRAACICVRSEEENEVNIYCILSIFTSIISEVPALLCEFQNVSQCVTN